MRVSLLHLALVALLTGGVATTAAADDHHGDRHGRHERNDDWRDRDIHHFHDHDFDRWRGGRWFQGRHGDRLGWWWIVGNTWYYYPQPIYPYPDPYRPPVIAGPAPPQALYYYCPKPRGYYPYVPACRSAWRLVPAG